MSDVFHSLPPAPVGLTVTDLDQHYGSAQVLRNVDFCIEPGSCVGLLGRNGAGKTTLLRCLAGLIPISRGRIILGETDITDLSPDRRARAGLAIVPQAREIFADLTVGENLRVAARAHDLDRTNAVDEAVALFPALRGLWNRPGGNLSGGQQQQLAIARALSTRPRLILLDEPTEGIQPSIVSAIEAVIEGLKGRITVLLVEQYLEFAVRLSDSFVVLSRGGVVERGTRESLDHAALARHIAV
jgi:urea transport system ATP-binding protein